MKLYAQHGAMAGGKIQEGFDRSTLDGVIFSPRDISPDNLCEELQEFAKQQPLPDLLLDPQYYTSILDHSEPIRLGYLANDYPALHPVRRRVDLCKESVIKQDIQRSIEFQLTLPLTHITAPNIVISRSFDSRETGYSIDFMRIAEAVRKEMHVAKPLLVTLALSRDALLSRTAVLEFANELTGLSLDVSGFYVLVAATAAEARSQILHTDIVAGWMYLNYALASNKYVVVNGYSDVLTPFLGVAGGYAGATGWWSNLRAFSMERFAVAPSGGRLPVQRYLSKALLNRITFSELQFLRTQVDEVLNRLPGDELYAEDNGSEPVRNQEVIQSWESIRSLCEDACCGDTMEGVAQLQCMIKRAQEVYARCRQAGVAFDQKSNEEHLAALSEGVDLFQELAELRAPAE